MSGIQHTETKATFTQRGEPGQERRQWRWTLTAVANGEPLSMVSEGYNNFSEMVHCFEVSTGSLVVETEVQEGEYAYSAYRHVTVDGNHLVPDVIAIEVDRGDV